MSAPVARATTLLSSAKANLRLAFSLYLNLGDAPRQAQHTATVRVGECIDRLYDIFEADNAASAFWRTKAVWNEIIESKFSERSQVEYYKDQMMEFHNYYYESLKE